MVSGEQGYSVIIGSERPSGSRREPTQKGERNEKKIKGPGKIEIICFQSHGSNPLLSQDDIERIW